MIIDDKIRGCLYGLYAGTELGVRVGAGFGVPIPTKEIADALLTEKPGWNELIEEKPLRIWRASLSPIAKAVIRTYIEKGGRIIPEDWAQTLKDDINITRSGSFSLLDIYSSIELIKEGMNPRISGHGACPSGIISTAAVPIGIFHAGDPEYAYIDAVEIASVTQRGEGVVWAALTAAAVAEALKPGATAKKVIDKTLSIAHKYAIDEYYVINRMLIAAKGKTGSDFVQYYFQCDAHETYEWWGSNPIGFALLLLSVLDKDITSIINISCKSKYPEIKTPIAGAIAGALIGTAAIPEIWRKGVESDVVETEGIIDVVNSKLEKESIIISDIENLCMKTPEKTTDNNTEKTNEKPTVLNDKIFGCILAGAIGNAMGSVVESLEYTEIDEKYPGRITTLLKPELLDTEDDNQMAMLLTETYIRRDGLPVTARDFSETWMKKLDENRFFNCMKNSYKLIRQGMDPRVAGHWNIVTGSTVMCIEPVGAYHLGDPENAYIDALGISYMYQRGLDVISAGILAASVAEAFKAHATVDSIIQTALNVAPRSKMITFDKRRLDTPYDFLSKCVEVAGKYTDVFEARAELYEKCLYYNMIDPLELLGLSFAMFIIAKGDVRLSAIGGTNIGRDSDTIAGRAAMLSGTLKGVENVPQEWIDLINPNSLQRIKNNSAMIEKLITERKLDYMKSRQEYR
ncbi:MAG: ADP-ribosylglycohydrolase family protein [Saccharofermentanales bacterium]